DNRLPHLSHSSQELLTEKEILQIVKVSFVLSGYSLDRIDPHFQFDIKKAQLKLKDLDTASDCSDYLYQLGVESLGENKWSEQLIMMREEALPFLRVNLLKAHDRSEVLKSLTDEGFQVEAVDGLSEAICLRQRKNVFQSQAFQKGYFEMQDYSSQHIAPLLSVESGMRVIDACAGAGGKTLHLASLMKNKGQIIALDIYESKLKELKVRAKRGGAFNIETRVIDSSKVIKRLAQSADRLLIDVPCTGTGVLRRNPDPKWRLKASEFASLQETQYRILRDYSQMLKPGGRMVYATCSILPQENQNIVDEFLASPVGEGFKKGQELAFKPEWGDGFYACALEKGAS
ncbi:MAG: methyltransferase domain-containing protein, partial [Bdellovibrionales bacterium]|nr:methyltransferase domain-containing protein [Bdellovibrionales bacterium]